MRTISCAPTNVAVAEVATRYLKLVTAEGRQFADQPGAAPCARGPLVQGDLVMVCNPEKLDLQDVSGP